MRYVHTYLLHCDFWFHTPMTQICNNFAALQHSSPTANWGFKCTWAQVCLNHRGSYSTSMHESPTLTADFGQLRLCTRLRSWLQLQVKRPSCSSYDLATMEMVRLRRMRPRLHFQIHADAKFVSDLMPDPGPVN